MRPMKPYSEDTRTRIVRALEEGMSKSAAARLFGVSLSSVKRYMRLASRGASLAPKKGGGRPLKADETTRKLLEEDVEERPAATLLQRCRFLRSATGKSFSISAIRRLLKRLGFSRKTECGGTGTRRVAESSLEGNGRREGGPAATGFLKDEMGTNTSLSVLYMLGHTQESERTALLCPATEG